MNDNLTIDLSMLSPTVVEQIRDAIDKELCVAEDKDVIRVLAQAHMQVEEYLDKVGRLSLIEVNKMLNKRISNATIEDHWLITNDANEQWSNEDGWVSEHGDWFDDVDRLDMNLPVGGKWEHYRL